MIWGWDIDLWYPVSSFALHCVTVLFLSISYLFPFIPTASLFLRWCLLHLLFLGCQNKCKLSSKYLVYNLCEDLQMTGLTKCTYFKVMSKAYWEQEPSVSAKGVESIVWYLFSRATWKERKFLVHLAEFFSQTSEMIDSLLKTLCTNSAFPSPYRVGVGVEECRKALSG